MFFADLRAVDSICSSVDANLNGEAFPDSLRCRTGTIDRPQTGVWLLNRQAQALSGVVGVDDKGKSDASAEISVIGDGEILGTFSTSYAEPVEVNLDVTGVLRLEITTTSATRADVVLGTWLVKGTGDEIAALESSS